MPADLISKKTRREFREYLVGSVLREIEGLFDNHDVERIAVPSEALPQGARRSLVECYYASIDWTDLSCVRKILDVYEEILLDMTDGDKKQYFLSLLKRDGYSLLDGRIVSDAPHGDLIATIRSASLDLVHLNVYIDRIKASVATDPALAIGSTKELLEATLKTILDGTGATYDPSDDVPRLLKAAQRAPELAPEAVADSKRGAETIRRILSNLGQVVLGLAELRNLYGTGHGRAATTGITARHARLAVGAGAAMCTFLLETYEQRQTPPHGTWERAFRVRVEAQQIGLLQFGHEASSWCDPSRS